MSVNQKEFFKAMTAAMTGPPHKLLKISKHEFNVKPVIVQKVSDGIEVLGTDGHHISHCLAFRPDDQVFFRAHVSTRGTVEDLKVNVKSSFETLKKWAERVKDVLELVNAARDSVKDEKGDVTSKIVWKPAKGTEKFLDGSWRGEANFLIANIIVAKANQHLPGAIVTFPGL